MSGIDPPTLRDVWATAPYLHDGSAATLNAAVSAHNNVSLDATQVQQVVAYLQQVGSLETTAPIAQYRAEREFERTREQRKFYRACHHKHCRDSQRQRWHGEPGGVL